jgi:xanthine dehydrogenase small subunit
MINPRKIQFLHNNQPIEIDFSVSNEITPITTVLHYLRKNHRHTGTKEGCGEGDCGACSVVLAEVHNNKLKYRTVNSCLIFLPYLHGKQLITVENLGNSKNLHFIQKSMLETNASQCGYCSPGFVMSMFPLFKENRKLKKEEIKLALAGNLCRCTGYRSILEAAERVAGKNSPDFFSENEKTTIEQLNKINSQNKTIIIETEKTTYFKVFELSEALKLKEMHSDALLISGSSDIALKVTKKYEILHKLIDISQVKELNFIKKTEKSIEIGAETKLEDIKEAVEEDFPALYEMLSVFGARQIRNMATLGGNLGSASPIGDSLPVLMAYNAQIKLRSTHGEREIPIRAFVLEYRKTQLQQNELITSIEIPFPQKDEIIKFYKVSKRKDLDISTVSVGFLLQKNNQNKIIQFKAFYGGMAAKTQESRALSNFLLHKTWNKQTVLEAANEIEKDFSPISDARSGADARMIMAKNLLIKLLNC